MSSAHLPVMIDNVLAVLDDVTPGLFIDCTFGRGGYTQRLLDCHPLNTVIALDRDGEAIDWATHHLLPHYPDRLRVIHARFSTLAQVIENLDMDLNITPISGIVFDLGVSSPQLDVAERGFSFGKNGPLSMTMGLNDRSLEGWINQAPEQEIATVIRTFGEERNAKRIARQIVLQRATTPLSTTQELTAAVLRVQGPSKTGLHPATRTFQALRIWVNRELEELEQALDGCLPLLGPSGKIVVVAFHGLEDKIVKTFFERHGKVPACPNRHLPLPADLTDTSLRRLKIPGKQPLFPSETETRANPRARSARMRYAVSTRSVAT